MYLKKLDIKGFKTFADNTEIFLKPGINVIVGPNGCGKSNIVDAIRWGLGESNIRNLRGNRSEDVIFNGTDEKRAQGMAYVEMLIDNHDAVLDFDYNEVNIGRKLFRSGESEFYINKSRVRLKDINKIFAGTGLGKKGYSIVGQGELEQVLNGQPLDRRFILEEASGIIKYRQQRDEVKRRINNTASDLTRVKDIMHELRQRKDELEVKADRAKKYLELSRECTHREKEVLNYEIWKIQNDLARKNSLLQTRKTEMEELKQRLKGSEEEITREEGKLSVTQEQLNQLREERHELENRLSGKNSDLKLREERINNYRERVEAAGEDELKYSRMLTRLEADLKSKQDDWEQQKAGFESMNTNLLELNKEIDEIQQNIGEYEQVFENKKKLVFEKTQEEISIRNRLKEFEDVRRKNNEKKERLGIHNDELKERIQRQNILLHELQAEQKGKNSEKKVLEQSIANLTAVMEEYEDSQKGQDEQYRRLQQEELKISNQLQIINNMEINMEGYSRGVKAVLQAAKGKKLSGILGLVGEIIDVPEGMETALEVALGRSLENIIVSNSEKARNAIEFLKNRKLGRVTFLPLDILAAAPAPEDVKKELWGYKGVLGIASDLIHYDHAYRKAVEYLLGRVLLVEDIDTGIKVHKNIRFPLRIVSREGDLINVSGAMTGGSIDRKHETPLKRKKEKKQLLQSQEQVKRKLLAHQREGEKLNAKIKEVKEQIEKERSSLLEIQFKSEMLDKQINDIETSLNQDKIERDRLQKQIELLLQENKQTEEQIMETGREMDQIKGSSENENAELEKLKEEIEVSKRTYEIRKERLGSYLEQINQKQRELESIKKTISQFTGVKDSYLISQQEAAETRSNLLKEIEIETGKIKELRNAISNSEEDFSKIEDEILLSQKNEKACRIKIDTIKNEIVPARQALADVENSLRSIEISIARLETEYDAMCTRWINEYGQNLREINEPEINNVQVKEYKQRIGLLHEKIEAIGSIDVDAIQEYEVVRDRYSFINQQYDDLLEACDSLNNLLKETEKMMFRSFSDFVLLADKSFNKTFREIFGGGEAVLRIEDGKEKLEAGIEIDVKLPGKRSQALNLLSGGERALTCIAFIFALLRLKPAPFCILDEIDAALDETNLVRFANFLNNMKGNMQYIIITHRQTTIESGENIYGVTMPEKGVSRVLTLNIDEAESLAG